MPGNGGCGTAVAAAAFDALPEPVWELRDDDLLVVTANRAAREVAPAGVTVLGSRFAAVGPGLDEPGLLDALRHVLRTGEPARDLAWTLRASGRPGPTTRYLVDADQVRAMDGSVRGVLIRARESGNPRTPLRVLEGGGEPADDDGPAAGSPAAPRLPAHMPDRVPVVRGARVAAHHVDAPTETSTGEWFDVVALPGSRVALVVGAVGRLGSAAAEAAAGSTQRAVLADCLLAGAGVAAAMERLDAVAGRTAALRGSTAALTVLDTATGRIEQARCGHLPAVLCGPGATGSLDGLLGDGAGGPLGVGARRPTVRIDVLQPGGLLLLHAGGPVDGAEPVTAWLRSLVVGASGLWPPAAAGPGDPTDSPAAVDVFVARLLDRLSGSTTTPGLTLLAVTRPPHQPADFRLEVAAVATELAPLRAALTTWLEELGVSAETVTAVPLVVSELVSNTVEHAYPADRPGRVEVAAAIDGPSGLLVSVSDEGTWSGTRLRSGYGLAVARELSDSLQVRTDERGTRVEATFGLGHPTIVHPSGPRARLRPAVSGAFAVTERPDGPPVVHVRGPLDLRVVDELRSTLLHSSGGGTRAVLLDLDETTGVTGAGVRLLYELGRFSDPPLRVLAPPGSVAHGVLTLAGLGHLLAEQG